MRVRLSPEARAEVDEAADWYATREDGVDLDARFLAEVKRVARLVAERPRAWAEVEPEVRRAVLRTFPYSLIFTLEVDEVVILAVAHHKRPPGYWRGRA
jgi:plasmid stabilization system protein ParE